MRKGSVCGVYIIKHVNSGRVYVGGAKNIKHRWSQHRSWLRRNCHSNRGLQRAWNKNNKQEFEYELLFTCSREDLRFFEQETIDKYKSTHKWYGFNLKRAVLESVLDSNEISA